MNTNPDLLDDAIHALAHTIVALKALKPDEPPIEKRRAWALEDEAEIEKLAKYLFEFKKPDALIFKIRIEGCFRDLQERKQRREAGLCNQKIWHGPGHQSSTYCEAKGEHITHFATYGEFDDYSEWEGTEQAFGGNY